MHTARKEFRKILPQVDLVMEVLDARLPGSSENPMLARLRRDKPVIKLLNKHDLADTSVMQLWQRHFDQQHAVHALSCSMHDSNISGLRSLCRTLVPERRNRSGQIVALIAGIPNVGKSTLINRLAGRNIARTGGEAAMTRMQQRIEISPELMLIDTPGMLWPKIDNIASGYRLAATGAIRDTALELQDVASFIAEMLLQRYPERLIERYDLDPLPQSDIEILEAVAVKRGCLVAGGRVDLEKVSRLLINELRKGDLGRICFETPQIFAEEIRQIEILKAQKQAAQEN